VAALVALGATAGEAQAIVRVIPAPLKTCPNPKAPAGAKPETGGLDPGQLAAAYGITSLWARGYRGQGRSVALIEPGTALGPNPGKLSDCYGPFPKIHQTLIKGIDPTPGGEGNLDPVGVLSLAPRARVYLIESGTKRATGESTAKLIRAALNRHNTGGHLVDAISMSFGTCEAALSAGRRRAEESALKLAASLGVAVFVSGGDGGSASSFNADGRTMCTKHPLDVRTDPFLPGLKLGLSLPASSPEVTSVGGTELDIGGVLHSGGAPGGKITDEFVWNTLKSKVIGAAGGGGASHIYTVANAPWEKQVGLKASQPEEKPDITAIASHPLAPFGGAGTSFSSPLMAGAYVVLEQDVLAHHLRAIGSFNPTLYRVFADRAVRSGVFNDVVHGTTDLLHLGCCKARPGFDEASGVGSVNFDRLASALIAHPSLEVPWTTINLAASVPAPGLTALITVTTNNDLAGTPNVINVFAGGASVGHCQASPCPLAYDATHAPETVTISADVGPLGASPGSSRAIVSASRKVTLKFTGPPCRPLPRSPGTVIPAICPRLTN
jgi:subtilisin family serine protease